MKSDTVIYLFFEMGGPVLTEKTYNSFGFSYVFYGMGVCDLIRKRQVFWLFVRSYEAYVYYALLGNLNNYRLYVFHRPPVPEVI